MRALLLLAAALALALGGCGGDGGEGSSAQGTAAAPAASGEPSAGDGEREASRGGEASIEDFGEEANDGERSAILASFHDYLDALAGGDDAVACSRLSATVRRSLRRLVPGSDGEGCAAILPKLLAPTAPAIAREQAEGEITKVRVEGDRAFVIFHAPGAKLYQLTMVREGGEWKAALVAASVLVPDLSGATP